MDEDVLNPDRCEDVSVVLANALREAGFKRRKDEVGAAIDDQLFQLVHADDADDFDDIHRLGANFLEEEGFQVLRRAAVDLEAHDAAAAALFQQNLELADKVFGLFLDLDVAVADDAQDAAAFRHAVREQHVEEQGDDVFKRDEAARLRRLRQLDEALDMRRDRHQRIHLRLVAAPVEREANGEALVRQKWKRVRRVDGERGQYREDALHEAHAQPFDVGLGKLVCI